jgi:hypothetical protein
MTMTNDKKNTHDTLSNASMLLILENLANEMARDARDAGRSDDLRPQALRSAIEELRGKARADRLAQPVDSAREKIMDLAAELA